MKFKSFIVLTCFFSLLIVSGIKADGSPENYKGVIKAIVLDAKTNAPLEYANVTVHKSQDSSYVNGSATGKGGELLIPNIPEGQYYVKVSFIGYDKTIVPNVNVTKENYNISLGTIKINPTEVNLSAVNVVAEKPAEEYHLDKRVINVSKDNTAAGGTALDVLQNHPSVQVDQEGNVMLRGSSNFTVLVNGRPGVLQGSDALRQIPANIVENIELITNPSAKYDAEGAAGIINIVTKAIAQDNMSGMVNGGVGSRNKYNGDATINYKTNGLGLSGTVDYRNMNNTNSQTFDRYTTTSSVNSYQNANIRQNFERENYSIKLGADYTFSPTTGIALNATYGKFGFGGNFLLDAYDLQNITANKSNYTSNVESIDVDARYLQSTFFFNHQFSPKIDEITFEAVYTNVSQPQTRTGREYTTDSKFENRSAQPNTKEFYNNTDRNDGRFKLNYSYKFNDKSKLESGLQANVALRNFDYTNKLYNWNTNNWDLDPFFTNQFDFRNNVYSAFFTYSNNFELLELDYQFGLRAEQTDRLLTQNTLGTSFEYNQIHLFPTFNALKKITDAQQLQFSYSRRINRPFEFALNPFPNYSDSYAFVIGNPDLLPELTNSFELNYQNTLSNGLFFSAQTYYRNTNNSISQTIVVGSDGRLIISWGNVAKTYNLGTELSAGIPIAQWFRIDPSVNLYQTGIEGSVLDSKTDRSEFLWSSRLRTTLYFSAATRFQFNLFYNAKQVTLQGDIDPIVNVSASLRQELFDKKLILTATAQNIFNSGKFKMVTKSNAGTDVFLTARPEAPVFNLTLSYNFNNFRNTSKVNDRVDINAGGGF